MALINSIISSGDSTMHGTFRVPRNENLFQPEQPLCVLRLING